MMPPRGGIESHPTITFAGGLSTHNAWAQPKVDGFVKTRIGLLLSYDFLLFVGGLS